MGLCRWALTQLVLLLVALESSSSLHSPSIHRKAHVSSGSLPPRHHYVVELDMTRPSGLKITDSTDGNRYFLLEHNCVALPEHHKEVYIMDDAVAPEICREIIDKAEAHQWTEQRHTAFATTDLPLETLFGQFSKIHADVDCHVLSKMAECFQLNEEYLQIGEIFIAKYEHNKLSEDVREEKKIEEMDAAKFGVGEGLSATQVGLGAHKDGTPWSFVIPLNDCTEFDGGGTHFVESGETFRPSRGSGVLFSGKNEHLGVPITRGTRYVMVGFINYHNKKDISHDEFLREFSQERDGSAASCMSSIPIHLDDITGDEGSSGVTLGEGGGIHTGDRLCGIIEDNSVTVLDETSYTQREDLQERLLVSSRLGRKGVLKLVVERNEDCGARHEVKKNAHRLLASQNYWALDEYFAYNNK